MHMFPNLFLSSPVILQQPFECILHIFCQLLGRFFPFVKGMFLLKQILQNYGQKAINIKTCCYFLLYFSLFCFHFKCFPFVRGTFTLTSIQYTWDQRIFSVKAVSCLFQSHISRSIKIEKVQMHFMVHIFNIFVIKDYFCI